jgi:hypothetical protein
MRINSKINSDFKTLNQYNKIYPWIPNETQIRPTEIIITLKKMLMDKISLEYNSTRDYILINVFHNDGFNTNGKLIAKNSIEKLNKFEVCRFRYELDPSTFHYIMWYTSIKKDLIDEEITRDIKNNIYSFLKKDDFSFVWYENPKMTIKDIYHVHVFWVKHQ